VKLSEFQEELSGWANHNFPTETREIVVLGLVEEVGELCRTLVKKHQGIRGTAEEWDQEAFKEIGDVFIKLVHVCHVWGLDIEEVVSERWKVIRDRDFVANRIGHGLPKE
jgi:NTP pyrophosphatase (non-canonical NTP hydrolase)